MTPCTACDVHGEWTGASTGGGTARRDGLDAFAADAVVREEGMGAGEGMTGGVTLSVRAVTSGGLGRVASSVRWAWPLGFFLSVFFPTVWSYLFYFFCSSICFGKLSGLSSFIKPWLIFGIYFHIFLRQNNSILFIK